MGSHDHWVALYGWPATGVKEATMGKGRIAALITVGGTAAILSLLLVAHRAVPGSAGSLLESALPWLAAPGLLLLVVAIVTRQAVVIGVALLPVAIWTILFAPTLTDHSRSGSHDLRVASLNLGKSTPAEALPPLLAEHPDIVVLEEVTPANRSTVTTILADAYLHHTETGTVAIFSRFRLSGTEPVDIRIGWTRAIATTVETGNGDIRVVAAHLASARADMTAGRDRTLAALAAATHADPSRRLILAGDLNTATTDRLFHEFAPLADSQKEAGSGFGFTWPAAFPVVRPDHILERGLTTRRSWVVKAPGSDHRAVLADFATGTATAAGNGDSRG
jgi:vancomycin resistance protein VanJ